jgi:hypothetical protein
MSSFDCFGIQCKAELPARESDKVTCTFIRLPSRHFCLALYPKPVKALHNFSFLLTNYYYTHALAGQNGSL